MQVTVGYIITNGTNYSQDSNCKTLTTDDHKAFIWKTKESAEKVLTLAESRKTFPVENFYIEELISNVAPINEYAFNIITELITLGQSYYELEDAFSQLTQKLSTIDRKISDVEHFIETTDQNACNGYKLYRKLKDLRVERRNIKRLIELKDIFKTIKIEHTMVGDVNNKVEGFTKKMFTPREITLDDILSK